MTNHAVLVSVRPRFAEMIFSGEKTVELRRVCPKIHAGDLALIYVSSPAKQLQGAFQVKKIVSASPSALWKKVGKKSGLSRTEFLEYFRGKTKAHALVICQVWKLPIPVCLNSLRQRKGGFRPPQNFHYLNRNEPFLQTPLIFSRDN